MEGPAARRGSLAHAAEEIGDTAAFRSHLDDLHVEIVLTMHPSDATRRAVLHKLHRLTEQLEAADRGRLPIDDLRETIAEIGRAHV